MFSSRNTLTQTIVPAPGKGLLHGPRCLLFYFPGLSHSLELWQAKNGGGFCGGPKKKLIYWTGTETYATAENIGKRIRRKMPLWYEVRSLESLDPFLIYRKRGHNSEAAYLVVRIFYTHRYGDIPFQACSYLINGKRQELLGLTLIVPM